MTEGAQTSDEEFQTRSLSSYLLLTLKNNWIAIGLIIVLLFGWAIAELTSLVNVVSIDTPYTLNDISEIGVSVLSLILTLIIAALYQNQIRIQKNQTHIQNIQRNLMEEEYRPLIQTEVEILDGDDPIPVITIRNTGREAAVKVTAEWSFAGKEDSWESPFLSSGRIYQYPLVTFSEEPLSREEIRTIMGPDEEIPRYLREFKDGNFGSVLEWEVSCEDIVGNTYLFSDSIDILDSFHRLEHITTSSELEQLQEMNGQLEGIQQQLRHQNSPIGDY